MNIEEKVRSSVKGDDKAFEELIAKYKEDLYRTAFSYVKNEQQALDILQETVYKAYVSIKKLKEAKYFKTWITKILINTALSYINKNKKIIYVDAYDSIKEIVVDVFDTNEKIYIWEAIESLETKHREVIVLKYFDDLTITEVARVLDIPVGTAKTYLNKGLEGLRSFMRKDVI